MTALHEGDRISNYILEQQVGSGSFGEVWRARHHVFTEVVAIKVPTDPQYVRNLQREGVAVHGLRHPNIVRALDLDPYGSPPYLVMEYVDGPSLRQVIDRLQDEFPINVAVTILRGMLHALGAAHEGDLIHRDVKPANILLNCPLERIEEITEQAVKVTDFGLGQAGGVTAQSIMQSGSMLTEGGRSISGTLAYMSPEQKEGKEVDGRSDLYACGIVLFEMLTGERPQGGRSAQFAQVGGAPHLGRGLSPGLHPAGAAVRLGGGDAERPGFGAGGAADQRRPSDNSQRPTPLPRLQPARAGGGPVLYPLRAAACRARAALSAVRGLRAAERPVLHLLRR